MDKRTIVMSLATMVVILVWLSYVGLNLFDTPVTEKSQDAPGRNATGEVKGSTSSTVLPSTPTPRVFSIATATPSLHPFTDLPNESGGPGVSSRLSLYSEPDGSFSIMYPSHSKIEHVDELHGTAFAEHAQPHRRLSIYRTPEMATIRPDVVNSLSHANVAMKIAAYRDYGVMNIVRVDKFVISGVPAYRIDYVESERYGIYRTLALLLVHSGVAYDVSVSMEVQYWDKYSNEAEELLDSFRIHGADTREPCKDNGAVRLVEYHGEYEEDGPIRVFATAKNESSCSRRLFIGGTVMFKDKSISLNTFDIISRSMADGYQWYHRYLGINILPQETMQFTSDLYDFAPPDDQGHPLPESVLVQLRSEEP